MLIDRKDPRFWDSRTRERRLRRGEMTGQDIQAHLAALPDAADKATASAPLEEPDERAHERRQIPMVRVTMPSPRDEDLVEDLEDDDEDEDEDEDEDDFIK